MVVYVTSDGFCTLQSENPSLSTVDCHLALSILRFRLKLSSTAGRAHLFSTFTKFTTDVFDFFIVLLTEISRHCLFSHRLYVYFFFLLLVKNNFRWQKRTVSLLPNIQTSVSHSQGLRIRKCNTCVTHRLRIRVELRNEKKIVGSGDSHLRPGCFT